MITRQYRFKFFLNARHALEINNIKSIHPHTWEIAIYLVKESEEFVQFTHLEERIINHLKKYESKTLNDVSPFDELPPTLEIIGEVLFEQISELLKEAYWRISSIEISETAARSYTINDSTYNFRGFNPMNAIRKDENQKSILLQSNVDKIPKVTRIIKAAELKIIQEPELELKPLLMSQTESSPQNSNEELENIKKQLEELQALVKESTKKKESLAINAEETSQQISKEVESSIAPEANDLEDTKKTGFFKEQISHIKQLPLYIIVLLLIVSFIAILIWITRNGLSPWGSDTWGHIFKSHFLYNEVMKGNLFPQYTELWYNGLQPFRYWAPLPYYIMMIGELISNGNVLFGYYFFVGIVFFVGAIPFILYGKKKNNVYLGTILGILYFILPDNYRLLFAEGNLPRVVVSIIFPYLLLSVFVYFEKRKQRTLLLIAFLMLLITLSHAMIAALVGITLFLFVVIRLMIMKDKLIESMYVLASAVFGIIASAMWLYPALKGGIVSLDASGNSSVMESLTYHISQSLNPIYRFIGSSTDAYYFGLAIFIIMILGLFLSKGQAKVTMLVVFVIFLGTTKWFLFILMKLPMSELFWMMRFTPMAMCFFLFGLLEWDVLKRKVLYGFLFLMFMDSLITMVVVQTSLPTHRANESIVYATSIANQRVAMMDLSTYDSDPSYHISYGDKSYKKAQVFGWAWQGATTATNIVEVNEAFTKAYYNTMFDKLLELGSDTVIVRKKYIENEERLIQTGMNLGYELKKEFTDDLVFQMNTPENFGTKVNYEYLAIGKFASNVVLAFPEFTVGEDDYIDHYTYEQLKAYKKIVVTGFKYDDKDKAEALLIALSRSGVDVYIDLSGLEPDMYLMRAEFLGVIAQPLNLIGSYPMLNYDNETYVLDNFKKGSYNWNTLSLANLDVDMGNGIIDSQEVVFFGTKKNNRLHFIGLNLLYYIYEQRDERALDLVGSLLGVEAEHLPKREVVSVTQTIKARQIEIAAEPGTLMPMAKIDAFISKQSINKVNNLSLLVEGNTTIDIVYPYAKEGWIISIIGVILFIIFLIIKDPIEIYIKQKYIKIIEDKL
ncbi:MAG: hypothetical protein CVU98_09860 [Firmicutes bacterium HGW-Firmicutes-3]|jgi:6-pyruvoyl tetrahydropterin synthase-like protein|nr:MAG: hypothetical protein CVU98_09860 [Firmicutes bacterium HGW-Firmicutes-3]